MITSNQLSVVNNVDWSKGFINTYNSYATLKETDTEYVITVEVPSFTKDDLVISLKQNSLKVIGKKELDKVRTIDKSFDIPEADENEITAKVKNGILTIIASKKKEFIPKVIEVK